MKDVSIIIVNYKTPQLCLDCIESIYKYTKDLDFEIILIDNGSGDSSYDVLKEGIEESVVLLRSEENLGFGRANNKAAERANGKYLFFLNSDTLVEDNVVNSMKAYLDANLDVGSVGVSLYNAERQPVKSFGAFPSMKTNVIVALSALRSNMGLKKGEKKAETKSENILQEPFEVGYVMGADLMMRANLFRQLGGFDNNIFMYFEESDLQLRAKNAGFRQMILPNEHILHLEGKSMKESNFKRMAYNTSMMYYMKKHYSIVKFNMFRLSLFLIYWINNKFDKNYTAEEKRKFLRLFYPICNNDYKA